MNNAPEFSGITAWINTPPLTMASLKGKVVGIEFFTHGCVNCVNAAPHMQKISEQLGPQGFVLIGVHTPEFEQEKDLNAIKAFLMKNHLTFPVAVDSDSTMWNAYHNQYWPTLYLIDKQGVVRAHHIGEGGYQRIMHDIQHLMSE